MTITIEAQDKDGKKIGNRLTIDDLRTGTINLDKKDGFESIDVNQFVETLATPTMSCADIKKILKGGATCKVYVSADNGTHVLGDTLNYTCNGGNVKSK